jgi:hypothetical protein
VKAWGTRSESFAPSPRRSAACARRQAPRERRKALRGKQGKPRRAGPIARSCTGTAERGRARDEDAPPRPRGAWRRARAWRPSSMRSRSATRIVGQWTPMLLSDCRHAHPPNATSDRTGVGVAGSSSERTPVERPLETATPIRAVQHRPAPPLSPVGSSVVSGRVAVDRRPEPGEP